MAQRDTLGGGDFQSQGPQGAVAQAKDETSKVAHQAKDQVHRLVSERKDQAAERLNSFASVLRDTAGKLNDQDENGVGQYADRAAQQVERLSNYLRDRDVSTFLRDTETFARRHPDVFLGGAFLAGLVLARFFKASSDRGDWNHDFQSDPQTGDEDRPFTTERYPGTGTGDALANPRPFEAGGV